jgi:hypothetical protein
MLPGLLLLIIAIRAWVVENILREKLSETLANSQFPIAKYSINTCPVLSTVKTPELKLVIEEVGFDGGSHNLQY